MPNRDRTGPEGKGPMTGRRAGTCAGYPTPGDSQGTPGWRTHVGRRGGRVGRGIRRQRWFLATGRPRTVPSSPGQEAEALRAQAKWIEGELEAISQRIKELEHDA